jgi:protoheme IX farnesyltransferase
VKDGFVIGKAHARPVPRLADYLELTKPRITLMVVLTAAVGYFMASAGVSVVTLLHVALGTAMVAAGASVLNQVRERDADARMRRTANRAIPAGRVSPHSALLFGVLLGVTGTLYITLFLNMVTAALAAITLASYVFIYTPLKRVTTLNTLIGAVPGALPPVGGWAAATGGSLGVEPWALFLILFLWQVPHFLALAWLLRHDYAQGGFRMLPVVDPRGRSTGMHIAVSAAALIPVSLLPTLFGLAGPLYFFIALGLSAAYAGVSFRMALEPDTRRAKWVFVGSILYLPALMAALLIDKLPA